jgi:hypothetical protein
MTRHCCTRLLSILKSGHEPHEGIEMKTDELTRRQSQRDLELC